MSKSILIVDDSKTIRLALRRIVESLGFDAAEAEDGKQALESCMRAMPNGVILDWNMPVMSGIDFLKQLRVSPGGKAPKVVFCSTENDLNFMKQGIMAGAQAYVIKPFDEKVISEKFREVGLL